MIKIGRTPLAATAEQLAAIRSDLLAPWTDVSDTAYTVLSTDEKLRFTATAGCSITVPTGLPGASQISFLQAGGPLSFTAGASVSIVPSGTLETVYAGTIVNILGTSIANTYAISGLASKYRGSYTWAALQASSIANGSAGLSALTSDNYVFITDWGVYMVPNAAKTYWTCSNRFVLSQNNDTTQKDVVYIASGKVVSAVASSNGGVYTRLTITAHGLTSGNNNRHISITGGTNWTPGLYKFIYVDANNIDVVVAWNGSFGNPTVVAITGSANRTTLATINIPAGLLQVNSSVIINTLWEMTSSINAKWLTTSFGGTLVTDNQATTNNAGYSHLAVIRNRGSKSAQSTLNTNTFTGGSITNSTVNTTNAVTVLIQADPRATANEFIALAGYSVEIMI